MMPAAPASSDDQAVAALHDRLGRDGEPRGYHLNPDAAFARALVAGLLTNERRYGYRACPCRLATGERAKDRDIICPCDYRDADLVEHGSCFCGLYVAPSVVAGERHVSSIPERRPPTAVADTPPQPAPGTDRVTGVAVAWSPSLPVWRCRVCGYLCAREAPPGVCPICGADQDRFERFG